MIIQGKEFTLEELNELAVKACEGKDNEDLKGRNMKWIITGTPEQIKKILGGFHYLLEEEKNV